MATLGERGPGMGYTVEVQGIGAAARLRHGCTTVHSGRTLIPDMAATMGLTATTGRTAAMILDSAAIRIMDAAPASAATTIRKTRIWNSRTPDPTV